MTDESTRIERVPVRRLRAGIASYLRSVRCAGSLVVVTRSGRDVAVLAPPSILGLIKFAAREMPGVSDATVGLRGPGTAARVLAGQGPS